MERAGERAQDASIRSGCFYNQSMRDLDLLMRAFLYLSKLDQEVKIMIILFEKEIESDLLYVVESQSRF